MGRHMNVRVKSGGDGFEVFVDTGGGGEWGVGVDFDTHNAALDVANSICEAKRSEGWHCTVLDVEEAI